MTNNIADEFTNAPAPYAPALIRLLQGVVYSDDTDLWDMVLRYETAITGYFARMGITLYLNENDGFAYLTQPESEESSKTGATLPRLTRRRELTYSTTLVLVLLREALNQFDSTNLENNRLYITHEQLLSMMSPFYARKEDERIVIRQMEKDINQVLDMGFLKRLELNGETQYLVRPILKARINSDQLVQIKAQLEKHAQHESQ
jgi:hypothetical protein